MEAVVFVPKKAPSEYPLQLFSRKSDRTFFLAKPEDAKDKDWSEVEVANLIKCLDRSGTTAFLKQFGPEWTTKYGCAFFPTKE